MISQVHAAACDALGWNITAVASRTEERAMERASALGAAPMRYGELVDAPIADTIIVSTPPPQHADDAISLLDAGWAVILEKPLCATLDEADALVEASERPGRRLLYAENMAYAPVVGAMLQRVPDLGRLTSIEVRALQGLPQWGDFTTRAWGGGALFDLGSHPVAIMLLIARAGRAGRAMSVSGAVAGSPTNEHDTDEWGSLRIEFQSGLVATTTASWRDGPGSVWDAQTSSEGGVLRAEILPTTGLEHNGKPVELTFPSTEPAAIGRLGYVGQLAAFGDDIAHGRSPVMDARFGRDVLEIVCAAYWSAAHEGERVSLPFSGPRDRSPLEIWRPAR
jgi:predicted dehydrogenase